jgi:sulfate transport system ATP-binding protein
MIDIRNVTRTFGGFVALNDISLSIGQGELVALLGPSGSGKTTLLRIIAGLDFADRGSVVFNGIDATGLAAREREVGFVFQHYALFRHMSVAENISFGLRVRPRATRPAKEEIRRRVHELLRLVQLEGLHDRYPNQLSGGQRQRVALARALAIEPKVLLLDEPFGALDARVRKELRAWLRRLHSELGITGVFVTHDQEEALEVADRVVVMSQGRVEQVGSPSDIYDHPANPFVYQFLGNTNALPCRVHEGSLEIAGTRISAPTYHGNGAEGTAFIRPHEVELLPADAEEGVEAVVRHLIVLGPVVRVELDVAGGLALEAEITRQAHADLGLKIGDKVKFRPIRARLFLTDGWEGSVLANNVVKFRPAAAASRATGSY